MSQNLSQRREANRNGVVTNSVRDNFNLPTIHPNFILKRQHGIGKFTQVLLLDIA